jgi:hypothetical protein
LKEKFMKASTIDTQMNKETGSRFALAMAHLKSVRDLHVTDGAEKEECQVSELGKRKGGGGGPKDKRKKKGGEAPEEAFNFTATATSGAHSPTPMTKVQQGRAAEKAAKRAASAASSAKPDEDKEAKKGGTKFGKGAHT